MTHTTLAVARTARGMAAIAMAASFVLTGCTSGGAATNSAAATTPSAAATTAGPTFDASGFKLTSPGFPPSGVIPVKYTCYGDNVSPPLSWVGAPPNTASFVLIEEDLSAGFVHWVIYDVPGSVSGSLPEDAARIKGAVKEALPYVSPCPPSGHTNTYYITFFALSAKLSLNNPQTRLEVEDAMEGKVIASTQLTGQYGLD